MCDYTLHCPGWFQIISWTGWICANLRRRLCCCIFIAQGTFFRILVIMHWKIGLLKSMEYRFETDKSFNHSLKIWTHCYRFLDLGSPKSILHFGLFVQELEKYSWHILEHPSPHVGTFLILFIDKFKTILTPSPLQIFFLWTAQKVMKIHDWKERILSRFCHTKMQAWLC